MLTSRVSIIKNKKNSSKFEQKTLSEVNFSNFSALRRKKFVALTENLSCARDFHALDLDYSLHFHFSVIAKRENRWSKGVFVRSHHEKSEGRRKIFSIREQIFCLRPCIPGRRAPVCPQDRKKKYPESALVKSEVRDGGQEWMRWSDSGVPDRFLLQGQDVFPLVSSNRHYG